VAGAPCGHLLHAGDDSPVTPSRPQAGSTCQIRQGSTATPPGQPRSEGSPEGRPPPPVDLSVPGGRRL